MAGPKWYEYFCTRYAKRHRANDQGSMTSCISIDEKLLDVPYGFCINCERLRTLPRVGLGL